MIGTITRCSIWFIVHITLYCDSIADYVSWMKWNTHINPLCSAEIHSYILVCMEDCHDRKVSFNPWQRYMTVLNGYSTSMPSMLTKLFEMGSSFAKISETFFWKLSDTTLTWDPTKLNREEYLMFFLEDFSHLVIFHISNYSECDKVPTFFENDTFESSN